MHQRGSNGYLAPGSAVSVDNLLAAIAAPIVLFQQSGEIQHANASFDELIATRDWLWIADRRLRCSHASISELELSVHEIAGGRHRRATIVLKGAGKRQALLVGLSALDGNRAVLSSFVDPFQTRCPKIAELKALFGLTENESQVAALIAVGLDYKQIADCRRVSLETIRSYNKSIFRKLGVNSRASVVSTLQSATLPLIWPMSRNATS